MTLQNTVYYDELFGKNFTVHGETEMIEVQRNYKITLTEEQARQLYSLLHSTKEFSYGDRYDELRFLHDELKKLFDTGIR
jgi:uncharacterized protein YpuA (DUF1002 family)